MDYEKKYKEALGMAEEIIRYYKEHNRGDETSIEDLEQIFPELKESEGEKIRKALIRFHKSTIDVDGIKGDDIITWLEKQGEQKPFDYESANIQQKDFAPINVTDEGIVEAIKDTSVLDMIEQKQEWSDEDEKMANDLIKGCVSAEKAHHFIHTPKEVANWLKSLKDRMIWKPSKEQMDALLGIMIESGFDYIDYNTLESLYNDLKKL